MKIHILCNDGSPIGVTLSDLYGEGQRGIGVGGSEYALLTMCEEWHKAGHEVVLYNNPTHNGSPFEQRAINTYHPNEKRDVLITFRSPNEKSVLTNNCLKVWWSCDQHTVGNYQIFASYNQKIVCISGFHARYFLNTYGIRETIVIDLPIRISDFKDVEAERVRNRLIFMSVPDRGLPYLHSAWPIIKRDVPEATLVITSDYRLWGVGARNEKHVSQWISSSGVQFMGAIPRRDLIIEMLKAEILAYPNSYDELFCISAAEAQVAGIYPVTSSIGALQTTVMGTQIAGHPSLSEFTFDFTTEIVGLLNDKARLDKLSNDIQKKAIARFSPEAILKQWNEKVFEE